MTDNLINLNQYVKENILSYISTAYETNDELFNTTRDQLLNNSSISGMFQESFFELVPRYTPSNQSLIDYLNKNITNNLELNNIEQETVNNFFYSLNKNQPYIHQLNSIKSSIQDKKHVVVTTGTGSGKTQCFVLPILINILLEALGSENRARWKSSYNPNEHWWNDKNNSEFTPIRQNCKRRPAIRCLIVYPLNALVQDQMETFREILDSDYAEKLYKDIFDGDRIYLGQYNGMTPGRKTPGDQDQLNELTVLLQELEKEFNDVDPNYKKLVQNPNGSELVTRWDMQATPPDILITNFTMLSIMLVRDKERNMIEQTKLWLRDDPNNIFYLVLDELHSYRGTAGTEISYTIKMFLERIGLHATHSQLRIISTSASLEDSSDTDDEDPKFLSDFFGTQKPDAFKIIDGPQLPLTIDSNPIEILSNCENIFVTYETSSHCTEDTKLAIDGLNKVIGYDLCSATPGKTDIFECALGEIKNLLKVERSNDYLSDDVPFKISDIAHTIFEGNEVAAKGLLSLLTQNHILIESFSGKLREHIFVKNLNGIKRAMSIVENQLTTMTLYTDSVKYCNNTNSLTLDCLYCQVCGEIYYRGFHNEAKASRKPRYFVTNDLLSSTQDDLKYVYINFNQVNSSSNVKGWKNYWFFNGVSGEISTDSNNLNKSEHWTNVNLYSCNINDLPTQCPECEIIWAKRPDAVTSPLRTMGTGYHKINQVVVEQIMRSLNNSQSTSRPKLITFSDSRKDAAYVSAELELNHYRDTIRATLEDILVYEMGGNKDLKNFIQYLITENKFPNEDKFRKDHPQDAILLFQHIVTKDFDPDNGKDKFNFNKAEKLINKGTAPYYSTKWMVDRCFDIMCSRAINPTGVSKRNSKVWSVLLEDSFDSATDRDKEDYKILLKNSIRKVITDSMGRDFESLGFGWLTFNQDNIPQRFSNIVELYITFMDSIIRFLSFYYKTRNKTEEGCVKLPKYFTDWICDTFPDFFSSNDQGSVSEQIKTYLQDHSFSDSLFRIDFDNIFLHRPHKYFWKCRKCKAIQLFNANNRCRTVKYRNVCTGSLEQYDINDLLSKSNYYKQFVKQDRHLTPLVCEELVGHTDKSAQRFRQLAFQDIILGEIASKELDNHTLSKYYGIDLLSVTTTMEAGVDIGGLRSVFMANMPPRRFNYQQRVGRAGRRNDRLSAVVTFCKGHKHDEYYFENPELIVSEKTSAPLLDIPNDSISKRVILKYILNYLAYKDSNIFKEAPQIGSSTGGNLSTLDNFSSNRLTICSELHRYKERIINSISKIINHKSFEEVECFVNEIVLEFESFSNNEIERLSRRYDGKHSVSEIFALEGKFPLYGMPIRITSLVHSNPNLGNNQRKFPIEKDIISRNEDIAISEFAPGQQLVKDKLKISCMGVAWYKPSIGRKSVYAYEPDTINKITICKTCESIMRSHHSKCLYCGESDNDKLFSAMSWSPPYYVSDFRSSPYNGNVNYSPQNILVFPEVVENNPHNESVYCNTELDGFTGKIFKVNSNKNEGFTFEKVKRGQNIGVYASLESSGSANLPDQSEREYVTDGDKAVLATEQLTDILVLKLSTIPPYLNLEGKTTEELIPIKTAWRSLAEILKMGIVILEDIEDTEISVGIRKNLTNWEVFLSDSLDNGAGYVSKYGKESLFSNLINFVKKNIIGDSILGRKHADYCLSSCYHCIRNYENRRFHNELDWRLGIDMLDILCGKFESRINFPDYWHSILYEWCPKHLSELLDTQIEQVEIMGKKGLKDLKRNNIFFPQHPFLNPEFDSKWKLDVKLTSGLTPASVNPFALYRAPIQEIQRIQEEIRKYTT